MKIYNMCDFIKYFGELEGKKEGRGQAIFFPSSRYLRAVGIGAAIPPTLRFLQTGGGGGGGLDYTHHITTCPFPPQIFRPSYFPVPTRHSCVSSAGVEIITLDSR